MFPEKTHGRAPDPRVRACQRRLQPLWTPLAGGCQLGRDIPALLAAAGFTAELHSRYLHRPHFAGYHYWGWAGRATRKEAQDLSSIGSR
jgi:hypothetical protein